jgi:uncharacterized membrane protein
MKRIFAIDFIRGFAIVLMIFFNYSVTLGYFGLIQFPSNFLYWFIFPRIIAGIFIFVSGVAAYVSYKNSREVFSKKYFLRGLKLLVFALAITFFTYYFVPQGTIIFGILHFFAFTSFLLPLFVSNRRINLLVGLLFILIGFYLQFLNLGFSSIFWLFPQNFFTFDYFPLLPWIGVLMLGIYCGKKIAEKTVKFHIKGLSGRFVTFLGKNSLTIYLIHQPLFILVLIVLGYRLFI